MSSIERHQAKIDYNVYGAGETTLLFVHGSYIDQTYFDEQVRYFGEKYKVVTFDLPGHGKSGRDRDKWSLHGFARDVIAIIKTLDLNNVILIGHSMGAEISLIAASESERIVGFISIDYFKHAVTKMPAEMVSGIAENLKRDFPGTNEQYARTGLLSEKTPKAIVDRVVADYRRADHAMGMAIMPEMLELYELDKKLLPALKLKMYLVNVNYGEAAFGETDVKPLEQYAGSGYELVILDGTSHFPMIEIPDALNAALETSIRHILVDLKKAEIGMMK